MILILDDTDNLRKRYNIEFLFEDSYKQFCQLIEKPFCKEIMQLAQNITNYKLLCHHRSLRLLNEDGNVANEEIITKLKDNFIRLFDKNESIEFGRDMYTNYSAKTIDKDSFYANLKPFIDFYIENHIWEIKILYYGANYEEIEKMTLTDKVIDEIRYTEFADFKNNDFIVKGLKTLFPSSNPNEMIESWNKNGLSKKDIINLLNDNL